MICCSGNCERKNQCGRYIYNLSAKYGCGYHTVESLNTFGYGSFDTDECKVETMCGANGNYAMYESIEMESDKDD